MLWDLFPDGPRFGGAPANFACHAARLGAEVSIVSAVGADARGDEACAIIRKFGVDTSLVQRRADAPTGAVSVSLDQAGKPTFRIEPGAAWDKLDATPAATTAAGKVDAVYFGTLGQRGSTSRATIRDILRRAKERDIMRMLDVNLRSPFYDAALIAESIGLASVLKLSSDELAEVARACGLESSTAPEPTLRALLVRHRLALIAMTCGAEGAILVSRSETIHQPGIRLWSATPWARAMLSPRH